MTSSVYERVFSADKSFVSVYTAKKVPTAMIFARCRNGVSHNPAEYSRPEEYVTFSNPQLGL